MKKVCLFVCLLIGLVAGAFSQTLLSDFEGYKATVYEDPAGEFVALDPETGNAILGVQAIFRQPSFSGSSRGVVKEADFNWANVTTLGAHSGVNALEVYWEWMAPEPSTDNQRLRLTTYDTANLPNPTVDTSTGISFWVKNLGQFPVRVAFTIRETADALTASIGANGGKTTLATGNLLFVGMDGGLTDLPDTIIEVSNEWQLITIPFNGPKSHFAGTATDLNLEAKVVLESLWFTPINYDQVYTHANRLLIDDFSNSAQGGSSNVTQWHLF